MNMLKRNARLFLIGSLCVGQSLTGCAKHQARPSITAVGLSPANRCEPHGIPYYLPKPLLVVAKNVRHIDESKVGLTGPAPIPGGFDNQAAYADIKANVTVPSSSGGTGGAATIPAVNAGDASLSAATLGEQQAKAHVPEAMTPAANADFNDGVEVDSFFTYQIMFIPDLTQKYGLRISGGAGEIRAAMNLVNGWMYTGMGPYYMKDSSSAQNAMATGVGAMYAGRGVSDVVNSVGNVASQLTAAARESALTAEDAQRLNQQMQILDNLARSTPKVPQQMLNYAEIYIYEPVLLGDQTEWRLVAEHHFDRHYFDNAADQATLDNRKELMKFVIQSMSATNARSSRESGTVDAAAQPNKKVDVSVTTPAGSTLRLQENGNTVQPPTRREAGTVDPNAPVVNPAVPVGPAVPAVPAVDAGPSLLNPQGSFVPGVSSERMDIIPSAIDPRLGPVPQVEVNVLTEGAVPRQPTPPLAGSLNRLHRIFHRETPKIVQQQGDQELSVRQTSN